MKNLRQKKMKFWFCILLTSLIFFSFAQTLKAEDKITKEIVIKVLPGIIALPEGEVAKVPITAARVRSTELRQLNETYNAKTIEKLYEIAEEEKLKEKQPLSLKGLKDAKKKAPVSEHVDLNQVFTREIKKEFLEEKKQVRQASDTYILGFEFNVDEDMDIIGVANAYRALEAVTFAQDILRKK